MTSSNDLFSPLPKYIQFTINIYISLESGNFFLKKQTWNQLIYDEN